jgi:predicted amidophosphoribosyltransferase
MFELSDRVLYTEEFTNRFIGLNCPGCGAPLKIKHGMSAICDRCGREVSA